MENRYIEEDVRKRLILAGLDELCEHGMRDFSLRRVALCAQVSCAAPYRHFKDKEELILGIFGYVLSKWQLLCKTIRMAFDSDPKRLSVELSIANIRFWLANGNFRTVLMTDSSTHPRFRDVMNEFDTPMLEASRSHLVALGLTDGQIVERQLTLRSVIYGSVMLISTGRVENTPENIDIIRARIEDLLV